MLNEDPASLVVLSNLGLGIGMLDGLSVCWAWPLPLGVPLYVPVADMLRNVRVFHSQCLTFRTMSMGVRVVGCDWLQEGEGCSKLLGRVKL